MLIEVQKEQHEALLELFNETAKLSFKQVDAGTGTAGMSQRWLPEQNGDDLYRAMLRVKNSANPRAWVRKYCSCGKYVHCLVDFGKGTSRLLQLFDEQHKDHEPATKEQAEKIREEAAKSASFYLPPAGES